MDNMSISLILILCTNILFSLGSLETDHSDNHAKVLILGAGATGIKAAQVFHDNGMDDFLIIEGADYIGGRVKHDTFANVTVELGAQWVTPGDTEMIDWVLNDWKLDAFPMDWDSVTLRNGSGHIFSDKEADPVWDRFEEALDKSVDIAQDIVDNDKLDVSQKAALRMGNWAARTPLEKIIEWFTYDFEDGEGTDVTALLTLAFTNTEDTHFMVDQRGYSTMFDKIAPFLSTPMYANHTRLNQRIVRVDYDNDDKLIRVHCEDDTIYTGEYALVTFSIGVLQSNLVEFKPKLPLWKMEEIYQMHMAAYGVIYMKFPDKFWGDEQQLLHVNKRYNYFPYFLNREAFGHLPDDTHILVAHFLGNEAWRIEYQSHQSEEKIKEEVESVLQHMYGLESPPRATEFRVVTDWLQNPLTMGSFSNWPVEIHQQCAGRLQARVGQIFFGGEATDNNYNGYIYGALRSGEREAYKILDCMDDRECPEYKPSSDNCECSASTVTRMNFITILSLVVLGIFA